MGNVCDAFWPIAKRHMAQSQDDAELDLRVADAHGAVTHFVKKSTKFRTILAALIVDGIDPDTIRMMVDGQRVNPEECPGDYDMESGDTIHCIRHTASIDAQHPPVLARVTVTVTVPALCYSWRPRSQLEMSVQRSPTRPLHDLFDSYAKRQDIRLESLCWSFDGMAVRGDQTPADLGLEAGGQLDLVATLTWSPPPGELPPELLRNVLEFLPLDGVHEMKQVSFWWREMGRSAIMRGRWKSVNAVAVYGRIPIYYRTVPISELTDCQAAWKEDPEVTLRILLTSGWLSLSPFFPRNLYAAHFLAIVEPSLDGLERIVRLLEPAQRFVYARRQLFTGGLDLRNWNTPTDVIVDWAELIGAPLGLHSNSFDSQRRNLVRSYVSGALRSWADAAVAADFFCCFFGVDEGNVTRVPPVAIITRGWDDDKASALAAARVAFLARCNHGRTRAEGGLANAILRVEQLLRVHQLQPQQLGRLYNDATPNRNHSYVEYVEKMCRCPGNYYKLY